MILQGARAAVGEVFGRGGQVEGGGRGQGTSPGWSCHLLQLGGLV